MSIELPPQRRMGNPGRPGGQGPGAPGQGPGRGMTPAQAAEDAERRLGRPAYYATQVVEGMFACIACQFQIFNRRALPGCPECGELIWIFMGEGARPVPQGETPGAAAPAEPEAPAVTVQEGVSLQATPVRVEENVRIEPTG